MNDYNGIQVMTCAACGTEASELYGPSLCEHCFLLFKLYVADGTYNVQHGLQVVAHVLRAWGQDWNAKVLLKAVRILECEVDTGLSCLKYEGVPMNN